MNILLGVSGSIAAYKACDLITELRDPLVNDPLIELVILIHGLR